MTPAARCLAFPYSTKKNERTRNMIYPTLTPKRIGLPLLILILALTKGTFAQDFHVLQTRAVTLYYAPSLRTVAGDISRLYPKVYRDLIKTFGWKLTCRPSVVLIKNRKRFLEMAESPLVVAFAVPEKNLIVMDYSRIPIQPFRPEVTLKHELCHLLLHQHIREGQLPRWLDEGLCQWASDGMDEIIMDQENSLLNRAAISRDFIPLRDLRNGFPRDETGMVLAYQESKSFVTYLFARFGNRRVMHMLELLREGTGTGAAFQAAFSTPLEKIEKAWQHSLRPKAAWLAQIAYHLYEILFAFGALVTVYAFVRIFLKKRRYQDSDEDPDENDV